MKKSLRFSCWWIFEILGEISARQIHGVVMKIHTLFALLLQLSNTQPNAKLHNEMCSVKFNQIQMLFASFFFCCSYPFSLIRLPFRISVLVYALNLDSIKRGLFWFSMRWMCFVSLVLNSCQRFDNFGIANDTHTKPL